MFTLTHYFTKLSQQGSTGKLTLHNGSQEFQFYLFMGRLLYATSKHHRVRRWQRAIAPLGLNLVLDSQSPRFPEPWEYFCLSERLQQRHLTLAQAKTVLETLIKEVLFDVCSETELECQWLEQGQLPYQIALFPSEPLIQTTLQTYQDWQQVGWPGATPHHAPVLQQPELLQRQIAPKVFENLISMLNGQKCFWDLALKLGQSVAAVATSLRSLHQSRFLRLQELPDLAAPFLPSALLTTVPAQQSVIACVDDSPLICQTIKQILTPLGYHVEAVLDPLRGITTLLNCNPSLVFLDLVMPGMNGYEFCRCLRKTSALSKVPIVILTSYNGVIDRMEARLAGASEFVSKPPDAKTLVDIVQKYLIRSVDTPTIQAAG